MFKLDDTSLRVGRRLVRPGQHIRIQRSGNSLEGEFKGVEPPRPIGGLVRERQPRIMVAQSNSLMELVSRDETLDVELL